MPPALPDYWAPYRPEESIARLAVEWRIAGGIYSNGNFDVIHFIENTLIQKFTQKGILRIEFFDAASDDDPAYVTYNPLTLHIDAEVWNEAKVGEPKARHIVAHEIG